jgi:thioredoxin 2
VAAIRLAAALQALQMIDVFGAVLSWAGVETDAEAEPKSTLYPCSACGATNRIQGPRVGDDPQCGRCHKKIFPRHAVTVTDDSWQREVEQSPIPVLVDFWAPWCGPCRTVGPMLEEVARERGGKLKIAKLNVDENPRLSARFGVQAIPTMILFRGAVELDQIRGAVPKSVLEGRLARFIS